MKVIVTGATGMVGEGILFECLENPKISEILSISRKSYGIQNPKVRELIVPDFTKLSDFATDISGYDACFFGAGISSVGMNEEKFTQITYDTTLAFAKSVLSVNDSMCFCYVSGSGTDRNGRLMWQRVKGKTEDDLANLGFRSEFNFRPGVMLPFEGQKNWKWIYKVLTKIIQLFASKSVLTLAEVGKAMIKVSESGYSKTNLEISDIKKLATA
ncbi:NAD-dependent epimerase/dehydratase family protein [Flavobacterium silvaticum]|uniref:Epimerase n=1 Tax=Flavobacterium silvaticum TaxID=1852020 RepID=A0A972FLB2_9FLAO|nr:NAD-dependent epimerase/dehydratase family protein [Flavobacterium silvaticum]NMH28149.1 epimerase [Flavobacterium silvaticum]